MFNHDFKINQSTLDLELKLRNVSEEKKLELVLTAHQDCVSGGASRSFSGRTVSRRVRRG